MTLLDNKKEFPNWDSYYKEKDVVNLYDSLSDLMKITTGGDMLNFGFWDNTTSTPLEAQNNMCTIFGKIARLASNQHIIDVGSGISSPALQWYSNYHPSELTCVNINFKQLQNSIKNITKSIDIKNNDTKNFTFLNSTATMLPFASESVDRVVTLESAQHFKPLRNFISESYRILKKNGSNVYEPLARYYIENRESIKPRISSQYPSYVEKILFKSLNKMKEVSQKKIIDYILITCQK